MDNLKLIREVKESMPDSIAAIGYGSGIFKQTGYSKNEVPDKDIILVVDNFRSFLLEDLEKNPSHFSDDFDRRILEKIKDKTNYYNNLGCLKFYKDNVHYKVMIISKEALEFDLKTWKYFGMAGRLTKPILYDDIPKELERLIKRNRTNALITALLYNSQDRIKRKAFYQTISKMTYMYDFRTILPGEKKTKSDDIVKGAIDWFDNYYLYNQILQEKTIMEINGNNYINKHPLDLVDSLPENLSTYIKKKLNVSSAKELTEEYIKDVSRAIDLYLLRTNLPNSVRLAIASSSTLGAKETIKHGFQKFKKHLKH